MRIANMLDALLQVCIKNADFIRQIFVLPLLPVTEQQTYMHVPQDCLIRLYALNEINRSTTGETIPKHC